MPAHKGLIAKGLDYPDATPQAAEALKAWGQQVADISPVGYQLQGYPQQPGALQHQRPARHPGDRRRADVDEALERIDADLAEA